MIIPTYVLNIISTLEKRGYLAFMAGGCVRDMLLGIEPEDYDVTTSASREEIGDCFAKTIPIGLKHGTVAVLIQGHSVEVTTFRGCLSRCDASFGSSLEQDLAGRDFTINAMAMDVAGRIYDPWGGQLDLENRVLRATGNQALERFTEDPLRMMRAIRFCTTYGLEIVPATYEMILKYHHLLTKVSRERVRDELNRILLSDQPAQGIRMLYESGLMHYIIPELEIMVGLDQRTVRHNRDLFEHTLAVLEGVPARLNVRLAALLHDIGKPACFTIDEDGKGHFYGHHLEGITVSREILQRLKYDNHTCGDVCLLVREHMSRFSKLRNASMKKLIRRLGEHNLQDLLDLQRADTLGSAPPYDFSELEIMEIEIRRILLEMPPLEIKDLAVNGSDLIDLGFVPGPVLGEALQVLLDLVLENPNKNRRDILLEIAQQGIANSKNPWL